MKRSEIATRCKRDGTCQLWQGAINSEGHPVMRYKGKVVPVRRVVMARKLRKGLVVRATCERRRCVAECHLKMRKPTSRRVNAR